MTWIPCGFCGTAPCVCQQTYRPQPPTFTWTGATVPTYGPPPQRLSNEDVDRIADRVLDKTAERIAAARAQWAAKFRERVRWMRRLLGSIPDDGTPTPGGS